MGCCSDKSINEKENSRKKPQNNYEGIQTTVSNNLSPERITVKPKEKEDITLLQNDFIEKFMNKTLNEEGEERRTGLFIKSEKKKVEISKDTIRVEDEIILNAKIEETSYFSSFWYLMITEPSKLKLKKFYIEDNEVNDSDFQIDDQNIQIKFPNQLKNEQILKIKIIQEISLENKNYNSLSLYLKQQDSLVKYIVYAIDDIVIDEVINSYFKKIRIKFSLF